MKTRIHVNQHVIRANKKEGHRDPPLTVKTSLINTKAHTARILDAQGVEVARVVYSPDKPLPCGAQVWVETDLAVDTT